MHPLFHLQPVAGPVAERFRPLHRDFSIQCRLFETVFLYPEDRIAEGALSIEVDQRWIRPVSRRVFLDPYFHGENEIPLISGSQFGVFSGFDFDHPLVVGIIGKSLLSGHVGGMSIAVVQKDKGLVKKHRSNSNPADIKRELIAQGSLAYALQR